MAKDQDLKFLRAAVGTPTSQQPRERTHEEGQDKEHRWIVEERLDRARIGVSDPYGLAWGRFLRPLMTQGVDQVQQHLILLGGFFDSEHVVLRVENLSEPRT
jgi:hypothetical protein